MSTPTATTPERLTPGQAAARLGLTTDRLRQLATRLLADRDDRGHRTYSAAAVAAYAAERATPTPGARIRRPHPAPTRTPATTGASR